MQLISVAYRWYYLFTLILIVALVFLYADMDAIKQKPRKIVVVLWMLPWAYFLLNTLLFSSNFLPLPILMLLFFPLLYLVFPKKDEIPFFIAVTQGVSIAFCLFIVLSLLFRPFIGRPYVGILTNANGLGRLVTIIFALLLSFIQFECSGKVKKNFFILIGFACSFAFLSLSRTTWLSCAAVFLAFLFVNLYKSTKQKRKELLCTILHILLSTVLSIAILLGSTAMFFSNTTGLSKLNLPQLPTDAFALLDRDNYIPWNLRFSNFSFRFFGSFLPGHILYPLFGEQLPDDQAPDAGDIINELSTDRIAIWSAYADTVGIFAKTAEERPFVEDIPVRSKNAHNTFFELAFIGGLITAVSFVLLKVYLLLQSAKLSLTQNNKKSYIYSLSIIIAVFFSGIFSSVYSPTDTLMGLMFYLSIIPIFNHLRYKQSPV